MPKRNWLSRVLGGGKSPIRVMNQQDSSRGVVSTSAGQPLPEFGSNIANVAMEDYKRVLEDFTAESPLGEGGMGKVWLSRASPPATGLRSNECVCPVRECVGRSWPNSKLGWTCQSIRT